MAVETDNRLGCGRDIDDVWSHADAPPTTHEGHCEHCQAARRSLSDLNEATRQLKSADLGDPELHLASEVLDKVTSIARAEVRRGSRIPLLRTSDEEAQLVISEQAIATVIRHTSDQIPGIETRRCVARTLGAANLESRSPATIAVHLRVSVSAKSRITDQVAELRERLRHAIDAEVGVSATTIDVVVEDLNDD